MRRAGAVLLLCSGALFGEAGLIIPSGKSEPEEKTLSIGEMEIAVRIDAGTALVQTKQIFRNHSGGVLEGTYTFSLPSRAIVSDFAVWDDVVRIPGVILERRRAEEIYNIAKQQAIDPGLLQMGEHGADEARHTAVFSARIVPIPAHGSKRVELEYHERVAVEQFQSYFAIPLRPDAYRAVTAARLSISVEIASPHPLVDVQLASKAYGLNVTERTPNRFRARWEGQNVLLSEDFAIVYKLDPARGDSVEWVAHRQPNENGFVQASALIADRQTAAQGAPRTVVALFDASLSMQWEKLERTYLALERLLRSLRPADRFGVVVFNGETASFAPAVQAATPEAVDKALAFVRGSRLRGGTDLPKALEAGVAMAQAGPESYVVLLSDGAPTKGQEIRGAAIAKWYAGRASGVRTYVFAVGDNANVSLLRQLTGSNGVLEWIRSTEAAEFKLQSFLSKIGRKPVEGIALGLQPPAQFEHVYALEHNPFPGAVASWIAQYKQAGAATATVKGVRDGSPVQMTAQMALPAVSAEHPQLPRTWAKARVDALLDKIDREGEDTATIDEIIRLARKYKFVTPYTSFLAAPRALLRPRVIRPGDPVLRVRTDASIASVVALFPFGLVKNLRYLAEEDVWQTRFLAPVDMADGTHTVRLILRDKAGRVFRESKTFVIVSKPPQVRARLERAQYRAGDRVKVFASAPQSARTVIARAPGAAAVYLRWNERDRASSGEFVVPAHLPPGRYTVEVTAEDFAHNTGRGEVQLEVLP